MTELEKIIMSMIAFSGSAKSSAFLAIAEAKKNQFDDADKLMAEGKQSIIDAGKEHLNLLKGEKGPEFSVLLMHAEDQFLTSQMMLEIAQEFIDLWKSKFENK